jgi:hypothetical protein
MAEKPEWVGLGTAIARMTTRVGIKPCAGCKRRKEALDRLFPKAIRQSPDRPAWMDYLRSDESVSG